MGTGALGGIGLIVGVIFLVIAAFALISGISRLYRKVPPNQAMIVYGRGKTFADAETGRMTQVGFDIVTGGGRWVRPLVEEVAFIPLDIITIPVKGDEVRTTTGVPLLIDWVAQIKIGGDRESIATAAQVFLGKNQDVIQEKARQTLSGNLREVISRMTVEQVHRERDQFVAHVHEIISDEMALMGLKLISLTIQDLYDRLEEEDAEGRRQLGYFAALSAKDIAEVRKNATVAQAEADRVARERRAQENLAAKQAELTADISIKEAEKKRDVNVAAFKMETDQRKAEADVAYDLQDAEMRRQLAIKDGAVEVEKQRQVALAAEQAIEVAKRQKQAELVVPAEAQMRTDRLNADATAYTKETEARGAAEAARLQGQATADVTRAQREAEAEGIRATGRAEAETTEAKLRAQAEGERELADARAAQDEINLRQLAVERVIDARVQIAQHLANSLVGIGANMRVVQFAGAPGAPGKGQTGNVLLDTLMQLPELATLVGAKAEALAGKDVSDILTDVVELIRGVQEVTAESGEPKSRAETEA